MLTRSNDRALWSGWEDLELASHHRITWVSMDLRGPGYEEDRRNYSTKQRGEVWRSMMLVVPELAS